MHKKFLAVALSSLLLVSVGCKKKEETPAPTATPQPAPQMAPQLPEGHPAPSPMMTRNQLEVVVPDSVKGRWSAVKLVVEDKTTKKSQEFTVNLKSDFKIPNSNLTVSVGDFLPDFRMDANITSASNQPNNPAVFIKVTEGKEDIFKGWIYAKFPTIHPFEHAKFGLTLKEGVPKKG